jgi:hypothetical protein
MADFIVEDAETSATFISISVHEEDVSGLNGFSTIYYLLQIFLLFEYSYYCKQIITCPYTLDTKCLFPKSASVF